MHQRVDETWTQLYERYKRGGLVMNFDLYDAMTEGVYREAGIEPSWGVHFRRRLDGVKRCPGRCDWCEAERNGCPPGSLERRPRRR